MFLDTKWQFLTKKKQQQKMRIEISKHHSLFTETFVKKKQLQIYDRYMRVLKNTKTITRFKRGT